jgi:hypothetical protein
MSHLRIVWSSITHKPHHCPYYILFCRYVIGVILIICQYHHILLSKVIYAHQKVFDIMYIVNTALEFRRLSKVIDTN